MGQQLRFEEEEKEEEWKCEAREEGDVDGKDMDPTHVQLKTNQSIPSPPKPTNQQINLCYWLPFHTKLLSDGLKKKGRLTRKPQQSDKTPLPQTPIEKTAILKLYSDCIFYYDLLLISMSVPYPRLILSLWPSLNFFAPSEKQKSNLYLNYKNLIKLTTRNRRTKRHLTTSTKPPPTTMIIIIINYYYYNKKLKLSLIEKKKN